MKTLLLVVFLASLNLSSGDIKDFVDPDQAKVIQNDAGDELRGDPDDLTLVKGSTKRITFTFK